MSEHRVAPRSRTFLPARVQIAELGVNQDCTIRDMSDTGARIQLSNAVPLPPAFTLYIPKFERSIRVSIKWRRGDTVGVHFDAESRAEPQREAHKDARYVQKLEEEVARLKALLEAIREDPMKARLLLDRAA